VTKKEILEIQNKQQTQRKTSYLKKNFIQILRTNKSPAFITKNKDKYNIYTH